ncbi:BURP domain-containing protein 13-like isoform X2 [Oryza brachyantha]|uniref:BURP domain-containing protein 13-like isoform X2 n=1 Tax=Oryza brachyantha TaxID=4533 RepID=UPI001ADB5EF9|nr:BURP domain-containing protein 13-like isoform X2 [Oryza brachyantha]
MARFLLALVVVVFVAVLARQRGDAAPSTTEVFWRAVLPDSPLPDAFLRLLRPGIDFVGKVDSGGEARVRYPYDYSDYKGSSPTTASGLDGGDSSNRVATTRVGEPGPFGYDYSGQGEGTGAPAGEPVLARDGDFDYDEYVDARKLRGAAGAVGETDDPFEYDYKETSSGSGATVESTTPASTTVFFHEEAVRVGERLPFYFPEAVTSALGLLPRRAADSIPFTTAALPGVLALFGVAPDSARAAGMRETLRMCEWPTLAGESKFCATSLEALVEGAMAALGTRDVAALTSTLPRGGSPPQAYTVRAVLPVEGSAFVACHDQEYPYTVYRCHTTGPARAYMVEMEGSRGGGAVVTVVTVCHTDTSRWNPEHVSFKLLGTKPGGSPVCHLMPYGHIVWAKNVKSSTA